MTEEQKSYEKKKAHSFNTLEHEKSDSSFVVMFTKMSESLERVRRRNVFYFCFPNSIMPLMTHLFVYLSKLFLLVYLIKQFNDANNVSRCVPKIQF